MFACAYEETGGLEAAAGGLALHREREIRTDPTMCGN